MPIYVCGSCVKDPADRREEGISEAKIHKAMQCLVGSCCLGELHLPWSTVLDQQGQRRAECERAPQQYEISTEETSAHCGQTFMQTTVVSA